MADYAYISYYKGFSGSAQPLHGEFISSERLDITSAVALSAVIPAETKAIKIWASIPFYHKLGTAPVAAIETASDPNPALAPDWLTGPFTTGTTKISAIKA